MKNPRQLNINKINNAKGLTIVELMMTVTIMGIITSFAVPSYKKTIQASAIRNTTASIHGSVSKTRLYATQYNDFVSMCAVADINAESFDCIDWDLLNKTAPNYSGWIIYQNPDRKGNNIEKKHLLEVFAFQSDAKNQVEILSNLSFLTFDRKGYPYEKAESFIVRLSTPFNYYNKLNITTVGRIREERVNIKS